MKFGRNLPLNQVLEWAPYYVDYKDLKKLVSLAASDARAKGSQTADLDDFLARFNSNIDTIDSFYNGRLATTRKRLNTLKQRFGGDTDLTQHDLRELLWALMKMQGELENLLWYSEVNRKALVRITKSSGVKIPAQAVVFSMLESNIDKLPFSKGIGVAGALVEVNEWLGLLKAAAKVDESATSATGSSSLVGESMSATEEREKSAKDEVLDFVKVAIRKKDSGMLKNFLEDASFEGVVDEPVMLGLLQQAISTRSGDCVKVLVGKAGALDEPMEINQRNCIHRLVMQLARIQVKNDADAKKNAPVEVSAPGPFKLKRAQTTMLNESPEDGVGFLRSLLESLKPEQRVALKSKDVFGRMPIHYAARFGLFEATRLLASTMEEWNLFDTTKGIDSKEWQDDEGYTPLHLSVTSNYPNIALALINGKEGIEGKPGFVRKLPFESGDILILATKYESAAMVDLLLHAGVNVNWADRHGETALLAAARLGFLSCAEVILKTGKVNLETVEKVFGRTALHVAAVYGHLDVVEMLVLKGANVWKLDGVGWTAKEQAGFRGYMKIVDVLHAAEEKNVAGKRSQDDAEGLDILPSLANPRTYEPLKNEALILVNLGSADPENDDNVNLDLLPLTGKHFSGYATAMSVRIFADRALGVSTYVDLPILEDSSTRPAMFYAEDPEETIIHFDVVPTYSSGSARIGRAVVNVGTAMQKRRVGENREHLSKLEKAQIVAGDGSVIGSVTFELMVIASYSPAAGIDLAKVGKKTFKRPSEEALVVGHRGLGMNRLIKGGGKERLQLGENTIESMEAGGRFGAELVEFDVQLTSDLTPVIYHDFTVSETGTDITMHTMTASQFLSLNPAKQPATSSRPRSSSVGSSTPSTTPNANQSQEATRKGFIANTRGPFIQSPFCTLASLFTALPSTVGFNIEMKYPTLYESQTDVFPPYAIDPNTFCDRILDVIFAALATTPARNVVFSSFHADLCLYLRFKQDRIPVMFLTDAGASPVGDVRSASLQEGMAFAKRWGLMGLVVESGGLIKCGRLVGSVKECGAGMECWTYGAGNNDVGLVKKQVSDGIGAVIVDEVHKIAKSLGKI